MRPVTLMGMSGAGKTHFAGRLAAWGWEHYSCDFEIAKILEVDASVHDLSALSDFVGQVGKGKLSLADFKARQRQYYEAEVQALDNIQINTDRFVNDSTGSFCEIEDESVIARVAEKTKLIYIETDPAEHGEIIKRAQDYPKPLYYPSAQFDAWLNAYCEVSDVEAENMDADHFSAWVFPKLFESRLPKYERLAAEYGVKIAAADLHACESEAAFLELIGE